MPKMIVMQGLPASGKSTRAKEILASDGNAVRINKDLLRTMLHFSKFTGVNEGRTRDAARALARQFLTSGQNVIIDDTNLNPRTLQSWVDLAKELGAKIEHERMDTDIYECLRRDNGREDKVGRSVIVRMAMEAGIYPKPSNSMVLCDLDGTLCDITHRLEYVRGEKKNWDEFFARVKDDTIRESTVYLLRNAVMSGRPIVFVSARPERCRKDTEAWLEKNLPEDIGYVGLFMRKDNDKRDDVEVKKEMYERCFKDKYPIEYVIDDRPRVIRMWMEQGLDVIDVGEGIEF